MSADPTDPDVLALLEALSQRGAVQREDEVATPPPVGRTFVLGGARSGKSHWAERRLGTGDVEYVATARPYPDDPEWAARVAAHQARRPEHWTTLETGNLIEVLDAPRETPVLIDCLATWLTRTMDDAGLWDDAPGAGARLGKQVDALVAAWTRTQRTVVAVSNEVGCGVVPDWPSGRQFRDQLGILNARIAAASDEVWFATAGIVRRIA